MRKDLILDVIRIEHAVVIRCVQIDKNERNNIDIVLDTNKHYKRLKSVTMPEFGVKTIFVQGDNDLKDNKITFKNFYNIEMAKEVVEDVKKLVIEYNKKMNNKVNIKTDIERFTIQ